MALTPPAVGVVGRERAGGEGFLAVRKVSYVAMRPSVTTERTQRARGLRKTQTSAEVELWGALRNRGLADLKFRRQFSFAGYVLDFYCHEHELVVELDGEIHEEPRQRDHDQNRDAFLVSRGLRILRIANREVFENLDAVLRRIVEAALTPGPSPGPPTRTPRERGVKHVRD